MANSSPLCKTYDQLVKEIGRLLHPRFGPKPYAIDVFKIEVSHFRFQHRRGPVTRKVHMATIKYGNVESGPMATQLAGSLEMESYSSETFESKMFPEAETCEYVDDSKERCHGTDFKGCDNDGWCEGCGELICNKHRTLGQLLWVDYVCDPCGISPLNNVFVEVIQEDGGFPPRYEAESENITKQQFFDFAKGHPDMANKTDTDDAKYFTVGFLVGGVLVGAISTVLGNIWSELFLDKFRHSGRNYNLKK